MTSLLKSFKKAGKHQSSDKTPGPAPASGPAPVAQHQPVGASSDDEDFTDAQEVRSAQRSIFHTLSWHLCSKTAGGVLHSRTD